MPRIRAKKLLLSLIVAIGLVVLWSTVSRRWSADGDLEQLGRPVRDQNLFPVKIDYGNEEQEDQDLLRTGAGEQGAAVRVNITENGLAKELLAANGFNAFVSDRISLQRSVPDLRLAKCKWIRYDKVLPTVSIIVPFHNEHLSTLLRTAHSLLDRAPSRLVTELIFVDDNSTKPFLGIELDRYVADHLPQVRVLRSATRQGLIRARMIGAMAASGAVLVFIDSHCEAGYNWLPPLLQPVHDNYRTVTCPFIDVINNNDFSVRPQDPGSRGSFDWNLNYKRLPRLPGDRAHPERPFDSPVMAGGLFAISRQWFRELGGYDSGLEIWGGEQYELSFKIWMCGGTMVDVPCSRVAHVFRQFNPFAFGPVANFLARNLKRVAEVWMDDWKRHVYDKNPGRFVSVDPGDLSEQRALRDRLNCRSFDWFMDNVAFDLLKRYPVNESVLLCDGPIEHEATHGTCLSATVGHSQEASLGTATCGARSKQSENGTVSQHFQLSWRLNLELAGTGLCLESSTDAAVVKLTECRTDKDSQHWLYNVRTHQIIHVATNNCLSSDRQGSSVVMEMCSSSDFQKWSMTNVDQSMIDNRWHELRGW